MKVGSLFSGIGGLDLACERAFGGETVWQVEGIDLSIALAAETQPVDRKTLAKLKSYARHGDFNRRVLARHWPEARQLCDVRTVGAHNLDPVDVICGGFPCQDLSVAGKQAGLDGSRSGLYRELHRIVGELLPQWVVIENVPGLLKYRARLARDFAALGYGLRWQPIAAQDVGAPHRRRRVFVLACRDWRGSVVLEAPRGGQRVAAWPTPMAADGERASNWIGRREGNNPTLVGAARWPTPTAGDAKSSGSRSLPGSGAHAGTSLTDATRPDRVGYWPTPCTADATGGRTVPPGTSATGKRPDGLKVTIGLHTAAAWPTPTTQDGSNNGAPSQAERNTPPLNAAAGGALNPAWVKLLMGLPSGWSAAEGGPMAWPGAHAWPVGRGAAQPENEPPRLVEPGSVPSRNLRLRSLGNGVVPHQAIEAIGRCMRGPRQLGLFT